MKPECLQDYENAVLDIADELSETLDRARLLDHFLAYIHVEQLSEPPLFEAMRLRFSDIFDQLEKLSGDLESACRAIKDDGQRRPEIAA